MAFKRAVSKEANWNELKTDRLLVLRDWSNRLTRDTSKKNNRNERDTTRKKERN